MATLVSALDTIFNAAANSTFRVQATGGRAILQSRAGDAAEWVNEGVVGNLNPLREGQGAALVDNVSADTDWRLVTADGTTPAVVATQ